MYGLVFELVEAFVLEHDDGKSLWHDIKDKAGCGVQDGQFLRRSYHDDQELLDLVEAAADVLGVSSPQVLESFGHFWYRHHYTKGGQANLLKAQGATLRTWLSNLNAMHDHIQKSFPSSKRRPFHAPVFWCEDCQDENDNNNSILLHYFSQRGNVLAPMVVGIVTELALEQFQIKITMTQMALQGVDQSEFSTWRIQAEDPTQQHKLSPRAKGHEDDTVIDFSKVQLPKSCPMTGKVLQQGAPALNEAMDQGLALSQMQILFPFHILINNDFGVLQVGHTLPSLFHCKADFFLGKHIGEILHISRPKLGTSWNWKALQKLADQQFFLVPTQEMEANIETSISSKQQEQMNKKVLVDEEHFLKFKASMIELSTTVLPATNGSNTSSNNKHDGENGIETVARASTVVMFVLSPDVRSVGELNRMGLTLSDLPLQSSQRDAVFLGEYINHEVDQAHELDKLSKSLEREKNLSNTLLYNMLPKHIADDLRAGNTSEPQEYEDMSLFFSDIVGFTNICGQVDPWAVIDMLNQLYSVMDHLALHFNLYKVETIGDAYMCASGLPFPDDYHAENIANFAIAVIECVKHIKSPADGSPIHLRIGIHTGSCTAGVVGTLTPHYCLFGDMVNKTARHEQTGVAGRIQCSSELFGLLKNCSLQETEQYTWEPRGLVDMKGKGECYTYFLEGGTGDNRQAGPAAIDMLYKEIGDMLEKNTWKRRTYFRKSGNLRGDTATETESEREGSVSEIDLVDEDDVLDLNSQAGSAGSKDEQKLESAAGLANGLTNLVWDITLSREDYVAEVHSIMSPLLKRCMYDDERQGPPENMDQLDGQLYGFIDNISNSFRRHNRYHNFRHAAHIVAWVNYLCTKMQDNAGESGAWFRFVLIIAALVRDNKYCGVSDNQLEVEKHLIHELYIGGNTQSRYSINYALGVLENDFRELFDEIAWGCPRFLYLMRTIALSANPLYNLRKATFETEGDTSTRASAQRTEAAMGVVLKMARLGHFALGQEEFLKWNNLALAEKRMGFLANRGADPTPHWNKKCVEFMDTEVLPLVEVVENALPDTVRLRDAVLRNKKILQSQEDSSSFVNEESSASTVVDVFG